MAAVGATPTNVASGLLGFGELQLRLPATKAQWLALVAGLAFGLTGAELAWHHPLSGPLALAAWGAAVLLAALFWVKTPVLLLAPLPLVGLAPWSGWISFEEMDLLVTACGCGGYLAYALQLNARDRAPAWRHGLVYSPGVVVLLIAMALSAAWSIKRGFADAGGFSFGSRPGRSSPGRIPMVFCIVFAAACVRKSFSNGSRTRRASTIHELAAATRPCAPSCWRPSIKPSPSAISCCWVA